MTNTSRRGSGYHTALLSMIMCVILAILFGVLTYSNATRASGLLNGSQENPGEYPPKKSLTAKQNDLATKEKKKNQRLSSTWRLKFINWTWNWPAKAIATTPKDAWINLVAVAGDEGGWPTKWTQTRHKIAHIQERINAWRKSYAAHEFGDHFARFQELENKLQSEMQT